MKVTLITDRILRWLKAHPHLRDDDNRLIATIWYEDLVAKGMPEDKAKELCKHVAEGTLTNPESIRRSRQKVQEQNPLLRGANYKARKQKAVRFRETVKI